MCTRTWSVGNDPNHPSATWISLAGADPPASATDQPPSRYWVALEPA
jgi:hypothetical protein